MVREKDDDSSRTTRTKKDDATLVDNHPGIVSVAPSVEERKAYAEEQDKINEEVGDYEKKAMEEDFEKLRASGALRSPVNPDSKVPHMVHERHGQIAPPNQNPTGRCVVCGDPLAYGQNFVCRAHVRAG